MPVPCIIQWILDPEITPNCIVEHTVYTIQQKIKTLIRYCPHIRFSCFVITYKKIVSRLEHEDKNHWGRN